MNQFWKKSILFGVIMLSAILAFFGCSKNVYEDMTLSLSTYEQTIALSDDQSENTFVIAATVDGRPKDYNGAVTFSISNPTNSISLVQANNVSNGVTNAVFAANSVGTSIITVATKEGNLQKRVTVNVIREVEEVAFTSATLPLPRATSVALADYLTFTPSDTSQTQVTYSLALPEGSSTLQTELDKVQVLNGNIIVPQDADVQTFVLVATSTVNSELVAQVSVEVVDGLQADEIELYYDNNTPNNAGDDIVLQKVNGAYTLELARNTETYSAKRIYFNFGNDVVKNQTYEVTLNEFTSSLVQVDHITTYNNTYDIKSIGEGQQTLTFVIKHGDYPGFASLYQTVTLNVTIVSYPTNIELTNPNTDEEMTMVSIYDTYSGATRYGTPIKFTIKDQVTEMYGQYAVFSLSALNDYVTLKDQYGVTIEYGNLVETGTTVYLSHSYETEQIAPEGLKLRATSATDPSVYTEIPILFVRGELVLGAVDAEIKINKSQNLGEGYEYGMAEVVLTGIEESFDRTDLLVTVEDTTLVRVEQTAGAIAFVGLGKTGSTTATVSAPNGSSVQLSIIVFEALNAENTTIEVAGQTFENVAEDSTVAQIRGLYYFSIRNSLSLPISIVINGIRYSSFPTDLSAYTVARDLSGNVETSDVLIVKTVSANEIATQNRAGESMVTVRVTGYGEDGNQNQLLVFKFILNVEIPISSITTNASEANVYGINTLLSQTQIAEYGSHTIVLNTAPYAASYSYEDISWSLIYQNTTYAGVKTESGNTVTYQFSLGNTSSFVTLETNKLSFKQATVTVNLASTVTSQTFTIMAVINQSYYNATGNEISSRQEARVKLTAIKAQRVTDIVFDNVINSTVTFDARDLDYSGSIFNAPEADRTKVISFSVLPTNALTKDLAVAYSGTDITVTVDNELGTISVVANTKSSTGDVIEVQVYATDSVYGVDQYTLYAELFVEILDGSSEALAYQVATAADLASIDQYMNAYYVLTNNIDLSGSNWKPLGVDFVNEQETVTEFTGSLNGGYTVDGKTYYYAINGLTISNGANTAPYNHIGLFGVVGTAGIVKNITFNNVSILINDNANNTDDFIFAGVIAGFNKGQIQNNIINDGNAISNNFTTNMFRLNSDNYSDSLSSYTNGIRFNSASSVVRLVALGGVAGLNQSALQNNIVNSILINFSDTSNTQVYAGGIAGINDVRLDVDEPENSINATISKDLEQGENLVSSSFDVISAINIDEALTVLNPNSAIGGAVGLNLGTISNYVVKTFVLKGYNNVGGLVGHNAGNYVQDAMVENNLVVPVVRGHQNVGGLIGFNEDKSYYLEQYADQTKYNFFTSVQENQQDVYAAQVQNNRVEFVDANLRYSIFNTSVIADNFAGGLIGYEASYVGLSAGGVYSFEKAIQYNSVYSYYTRTIRDIATEYVGGEESYYYFGDIVLNNAHQSGTTTDADRPYVGGLIGRASNAFVANNAVVANVQAVGAIMGGVVGLADGGNDGIENGILTIRNVNVQGKQINRTVAGIANIGANFVGDATELTLVQTDVNSRDVVRAYHYKDMQEYDLFVVANSYSILTDQSDAAILNLAGISENKINTNSAFYLGETLTLTLAWTNRQVSNADIYHYVALNTVVTSSMITNGATITDVPYIIVSNATTYNGTFDLQINSLFETQVSLTNFSDITIDGILTTFDDTQGYMLFGNAPYLDSAYYNNDVNAANNINQNITTYNIFANGQAFYDVYAVTTDANENGIDDAVESVVQAELALVLGDFSVLNLTAAQIESKTTALLQTASATLNAELENKDWYYDASINGGMPVLLHSRGYLLQTQIYNSELLYDTVISLLSNIPPTDISVDVLQYEQTSFVTDTVPAKSVLFYKQLNSSYYLANGQINFGNNSNLTAAQISTLTSNLQSELTQANTYALSDVFDVSTVPAFLGKSAIKIVSSNSSILGVSSTNGSVSLVAKSTGVVDLTITSNYNTAVSRTVRVYVVKQIQSMQENGLHLTQNTNGQVSQLDVVDAVTLVKSTENNLSTVLLDAVQTATFNYNNVLTGSVDFAMQANTNGGIRYYLTNTVTGAEGEYYSVFANNAQTTTLTINDQAFTNEQLPNNSYVTYVDVPFGSSAVLSNNEVSELALYATPYILTQDGDKVLLTTDGVFGSLGRVARVDETELQDGYEFGQVIVVDTINGTWGITSSVQSVVFEPINTSQFTINLETDNVDEVLYVSYTDATGVVRAQRVDATGESFNGSEYNIGNNSFTIGVVTYDITYYYNNGMKTYFVTASVYDENKINEDYETLNSTFARDIRFFVLDDTVQIEYNGDYITSSLSEYITFETTVSVTLQPQSIRTVVMEHYPNGEMKIDNEGVAQVDLSEVAYNNIIPGYNGILKINVNPIYTNYDYITLTTTGSGTSVVAFEQMMSSYTLDGETGDLLDFSYRGVYPYAEQITNEIKLTKRSNQTITEFSGNQTTTTYDFDGFFYVKTLINSFISQGNTFTLTVLGFATVNGQSDTQVFSENLVLNVIEAPGLDLNYNGGKYAPVAIGTNLVFESGMTGVEGTPDFSASYATTSAGSQMDYGTAFSIVSVGDGLFQLNVSTSMPEGASIYVVGKVNKEINGKVYEEKDTLTFITSRFVINDVLVNNVINDQFTGIFNQTYELSIRLNATYNPNLAGVEAEILALEKQWSTMIDGDLINNDVWYYLDNTDSRVLIRNKGYSSSRNYIISTGSFLGDYAGIVGMKLQNIVYNAPDVLGAQIKFVYTNNGIEIVSGSLDEVQYASYLNYYIELNTEFEFGFNRISNEDNPEPIRTAAEFAEMRSGIDYILLSDIELENWTPMSTNIASLDGNGYVITLKSFNLATYDGDTSTLTSGNIGLFTIIDEETTIKNLTIEIVPDAYVDIALESANVSDTSLVDLDVDAQSYSSINFGVLAGQNNGIVTNTNIVYDASALKLERDLLIATTDTDNLDFADYYSGAVFDYDRYLADNASVYFPRKTVVTTGEGLWDEDNNQLNSANISQNINTRRDLSVVRINTTVTTTSQTHYMGALVGVNTGHITNSSVQDITISGMGYVAGLVAQNDGKISSSFFKGGNIINRTNVAENAGAAGLVVYNSGDIQYSYVLGREGDGNSFVYAESTDGAIYSTPSNYADKTGLNTTAKSKFAGYGYNSYHLNATSNYAYMYGALRAMNSAILASTDVGGFVYQNSGLISNSYSNILVNSSTATAGFVFENEFGGDISDVYSLSSVQNNSRSHSPFTGKDSADNYNNSGEIEYAYYLKADGTLTYKENNTEMQYDYQDTFIDEDEPANGIGYSEFTDYNSFQGFAFNSDYSDNKEITRSVWFMGNGNELEQNSLVNFKDEVYLQYRPELVAANLQTLSIRMLVSGANSESNSYSYVGSVLGTSIANPIIIRSAEEFNMYVTETTVNSEDGTQLEQHNYIRFVKDITFNDYDIKAITYSIDYYGDLEGNGMTINQLRLVSDSEFEAEDEEDISQLNKLGLFGSIKSKYEDDGLGNQVLVSRGVVRNLNIAVSEVRGTNSTYVGVLAGVIENASIYNILISGSEVVQGRNLVGGLAGYISGDSEIVNITIDGVGAKASYYQEINPFNTSNYRVLQTNMGQFELFYINTEGERSLVNANTISYVGGVAGLLDVTEQGENEDSTLRSARARRLTVTGGVRLVGEVVGGVFGGLGDLSTANDITFEVSASPRLIASRIAGGLVGENRGEIERGIVRHSETIQNLIDSAVATQANTATNNNFSNNTNNYNSLFAGNPMYMGGLIGFNNDGALRNAYNKVNVINLNSLFGGGIVGLNIGGEFSSVYTTATVSAFKVVGGLIGVQLQKQIVTNGVLTSNLDPNNDLVFFVKSITSGTEPYYLLSNAAKTTVLSGVSAINIWRSQDVDLAARTSTFPNADSLRIGGMVGKLLLASKHADEYYYLNDAFATDGTLSTNTRKYNEVNYYNQVFLNSDFGTQSSNYANLMQEIGSIKNEVILADNQSIMVRQNGEDDTRVDGSIYYSGVSGNVTIGEVGSEITYYYSRLQNLSSARTIKEFLSRMYLQNEAGYMSQMSVEPDNADTILPKVYYNWPQNYWKGIGVVKNEAVYELVDAEYVFPEIVPVADLSVVYVYTAEDLTLLGTYTKAVFILMNDIDLSGYPSWTPYGTDQKPFRGKIVSDGDNVFTISNLNIITDENPYIGLVGYADGAEFSNFNLTVLGVKIENPSSTAQIYIGSLYGYGTDVYLENINIDSANGANSYQIYSYSVAAMGGVAGVSENSEFANVSVQNASLHIRSLYDIPTLTTNDGNGVLLSGSYLGGAFGLFTNELFAEQDQTNAQFSNLTVQTVDVNLFNSSINSYEALDADYQGTELAVGGVFGKVIGSQSTGTGEPSYLSMYGVQASELNLVSNVYLSETVSGLTSVFVGGLAGQSTSYVFYDTFVEDVITNQTSVVDSDIRLFTQNYTQAVNIGGMFGALSGMIDAGVYVLQDAVMDTVNVTYIQDNGTITSNAKELSIGGAVGRLSSANVQAIVLNELTVNVNNSDNTLVQSASDMYIGGFAGNALLMSDVINVVSTTDITMDTGSSYYPVNAAETYIGGLFGHVSGTNSNLANISQVASAGTIDWNNSNHTSVGLNALGGLIGGMYQTSVAEAISNTHVDYGISSLNKDAYVGGLIGYIIDESDETINLVSSVTNSYSTGDISYKLGVFVNGGYEAYLGGLVGGIELETRDEDITVSLTNSYTISKFLTRSTYVKGVTMLNTANKGGVVGYLNLEGETKETTNNLLLHNVYYNVDFMPYTNEIGTGLTVEEMLLDNTEFWSALDDDNVFVTHTSYPLLNWADPNNNTISLDYTTYQAQGSEQYPLQYTDANNTISANNSYIIMDEYRTENQTLTNNTLYFDAEANFDETIQGLDAHSFVYGANFTSGASISGMYGTIYNFKGALSISSNYGTIMYGELVSVSSNYGFVDMVKPQANYAGETNYGVSVSNTSTGYVVNSVARVSGGSNKNVIGRSSGAFIIYGKITSTTTATPTIDLFGVTSSSSNYDFADTWIMFDIESGDLNYDALMRGAPVLRWTLKDHWSDSIFASEYEWASVSENFDIDDAISALSSNINVTTETQLGQYAYMASVGSVTSKVTTANQTGTNDVSVINTTSAITVTNTTYEYMVKTVTVTKYATFEGVTLNLQNSLDFAGKNWTPIGFGYENQTVVNNNDIDNGTTYNSVTNAFKGSLNGNGYEIANITSFVTNGNAGLFGVVDVTAQGLSTLGDASVASELVINGGIFAAVNTEGSGEYGSAGALAGKIYYGVEDGYTFVNGVGVQNVAVRATYTAGGVAGQLVKNTTATGALVVPIIKRAYLANSTVKAGDYANGITYQIASNSITNVTLDQLYVAVSSGSISASNATSFVAHRYGDTYGTGDYNVLVDNANAVSVNNTSLYKLDNGLFDVNAAIISKYTLQSTNLDNFDWTGQDTNSAWVGWKRVHDDNDMYPVFDYEIQYWLQDADNPSNAVTPSGTTYTITTADQLSWIAYKVNTGEEDFAGLTVSLANDINLRGKLWSPIGTSSNPFRGAFDGNNHSINGLVTYGHTNLLGEKISENGVGLFGYVEYGELYDIEIGNEQVTDGNISIVSGDTYVGGLVGRADETVIDHITNNAFVYGTSYVGGVAGQLEAGGSGYTVSNTYNYASVQATGSNVGGLVGYAYGVEIEESVNNGDVTGTTYVGGVIGYTYLSVTNTRNTGDITATSYVGGIVGRSNYVDANILGDQIADNGLSDNTGTITGTSYVGGIVGYMLGNIQQVTNNGDVEIVNSTTGITNAYAGGIAGWATSTINMAINKADIENKYSYDTRYIGGIVGYYSASDTNDGMVSNTYNTRTGFLQLNGISNFTSTVGLLVGYFNGAYTVDSVNMSVARNGDNDTQIGEFGEEPVTYQIYNLVGNRSTQIATVVDKNDYSLTNSLTFTQIITGDSITSSEAFTDSAIWNSHVLNYTTSLAVSGLGTSSSPYSIYSNEGFGYIDYELSKYFNASNYIYVITNNNRTISDTIGTKTFPFYGSFDANGYQMTVDASIFVNGTDDLGVFRIVAGTSAQRSVIKDAWFALNGEISTASSDYVGVAVGRGYYVDFVDVDVSSSSQTGSRLITANRYVGALAGTLTNATINGLTTNSGSTFIIKATNDYVGGIVGAIFGDFSNHSVAITSYHYISTSNAASNTGGFVGYVNGAGGGTSAEIELVNITVQQYTYGANSVGGIVGNVAANPGYLTDVTIASATVLGVVNGTSYIGGVLGYIAEDHDETTVVNINNATVSANITASGTRVGGVLGYYTSNGGNSSNTVGYIKNSSVSGEVTGTSYVGGIVGQADGTLLDNNEYLSDTLSGESYVGGIAGRISGSQLINNTVSDAQVSATDSNSGGIAGYAGATLVQQNTFTGTGIDGASDTGGIIGHAVSSTIDDNSVVISEDESIAASGGYVGGIVGYLDNSDATYNTISGGTITVGSVYNYIGGIIGYAASSDIDYNTVTKMSHIIGKGYIGGIVGGTSNTNITHNKFAFGLDADGWQASIVSYGNYVGGIVGYSYTNATYDTEIAYNQVVDLYYDEGHNSQLGSNNHSYIGGIAGYINNANSGNSNTILKYNTITGYSSGLKILLRSDSNVGYIAGYINYVRVYQEYDINEELQDTNVATNVSGASGNYGSTGVFYMV